MEMLTLKDFQIYTMEGKEMMDNLHVRTYCVPQKNSKAKIEQFRFEMKNILVLRPFASKDYIFVPYKKIEYIEQLKEKIDFKYLQNLEMNKAVTKNNFRDHLIFTYQHQKILAN